MSDRELSAELKQWTAGASALHPVGELLDRHWAAAFTYARLCTDGTRAAGMLTTAAFTRLFGEVVREAGPSAAWRPQLLVTVRRIAAEWDGDGRQGLLHPALRPDPGSGERAAARLLPPPGRRLLSRAFQRLPQSSRAVLWHAEAEGEPLAVPAALLDLDEENTLVELRRARERLRDECLQIHRELAPDAECGRYLRMLDVTFRRGGVDLDPDLRTHLAGCRHCRQTADQLARFNDGLPLALAEGVLGWGAAAYLATRAADAAEAARTPGLAVPSGGEDFTPAPLASAAARPGSAPRLPAGASRSSHRAARRNRRRNLALAVAAAGGLVVLPLALWAALGSGDDAGRPQATPSGTPDTEPPSSGPSYAGTHETQGAVHGRLHNVASGRCVAVTGKKAVKGAETELAACSSAVSQRWTYEANGLLRNDAAPGLCLDSHLGYSVRLAPCTATGHAGKFIRYDFTLQGVLVPRWNQDLALTPAATDGSGALVLKNRADTGLQHWVVDTARPDPQMEVVNWGTGTSPAPPHAAPSSHSARPTHAPATGSPAPTPSRTTATPAPTGDDGYPVSYPCAAHDDCDGFGDHDGGGYRGGYGGGGYGSGGYGGGGYGGGGYGGGGYGGGGYGGGGYGGRHR